MKMAVSAHRQLQERGMPPPRGVEQSAAAVEGRLLGTAAPVTAALNQQLQHSPPQILGQTLQMRTPPVAAAAAAVTMMTTALAAVGLLMRAAYSRCLLPRAEMNSLLLHQPRSWLRMSELQGLHPSRKWCHSSRLGLAQGLPLLAQQLLARGTAQGTLAARAAPQRGKKARRRNLAAMRGRGLLHSLQQLQRCPRADRSLLEPARLPAAVLLLVRGRWGNLEPVSLRAPQRLLTQGKSAAAQMRAAGRRLPWACTPRGTMRCNTWYLQCGHGSASQCLHLRQTSNLQTCAPTSQSCIDG